MRKAVFFVLVVMMNAISWQGCEYETFPGPVNCEEDPVVLELVSVDHSNCGLQDGSIEVRASGGSGNYRFRLGGQEEQSASAFEGLSAGVYEISVSDENTCSSSIEVEVRNLDGLNITVETTDAGCGTATGRIVVTPSGGTAPYQFNLNTAGYQSENTFAGLGHGEYTVVASDASGCQVSQTVKVRSGVSFSGSISKIIEEKCAVSGCHNGSQFPDFRVFKNIHDNAFQVKALTGNRFMPQEGSLTQTQIDLIACWVDDGALDN